MLTLLTSKSLVWVLVITKGNNKFLSLYQSKTYTKCTRGINNQSLINQSITDNANNKLCYIGIIILIVCYPLSW